MHQTADLAYLLAVDSVLGCRDSWPSRGDLIPSRASGAEKQEGQRGAIVGQEDPGAWDGHSESRPHSASPPVPGSKSFLDLSESHLFLQL